MAEVPEETVPVVPERRRGAWGTGGEESRLAKLTREHVIEIRAAARRKWGDSPKRPGATVWCREMGRRFGVSGQTVYNVVTRQTWGDVAVSGEGT